MVETEEEQQQDTSYAQAIFSISPQRLVSLGRSFQLLLLHRRCATCWVKLMQDPDGGRHIKVSEHLRQMGQLSHQLAETLLFDSASLDAEVYCQQVQRGQ